MRTCEFCGRKNNDTEAICVGCGGVLPEAVDINPVDLKVFARRNRRKGCLIAVGTGLALLIIIVVAIVISTSGDYESHSGVLYGKRLELIPEDYKARDYTEPSVSGYDPGIYLADKDLPLGEYVILPRSGSYSSAKMFSNNDTKKYPKDYLQVNSRVYVTLTEWDFIELDNCVMYALEFAPAVTFDKDYYEAGMYKIGADIPAGEYFFEGTSGYTSVTLLADSLFNDNSKIDHVYFEGRGYTTISEGQYLQFDRCNMYPADIAPKPSDALGYYYEGMYKIGQDIPPGVYYLKQVADSNVSFRLLKSSRPEDKDSGKSEYLIGSGYISVAEGEYLDVDGGDIYPLDKAPVNDVQFDTRINGMYLVGRDIPPGRYIIIKAPDPSKPYSHSSYDVYRDATLSRRKISYKLDSEIELAENEIITLRDCSISNAG